MSDYFKRSISYAGTHKPEAIMITDLGGMGSGLITGINLDYTQQMSRMWSLFGDATQGQAATAKCYLVAGDTNGNCSVSALFGLGNAAKEGDICQPLPVSITFGGAACQNTNASMSITMEQAVPSAYGIQGNNGNMQIIESGAITFISLSRSTNPTTATTPPAGP